MDSSKEDLRFVEPSSTEGLMPTQLAWEVWALVGGGTLVILLLLWIVLRRKALNPAAGEDPNRKAHSEAVAALALCPDDERTPAATECSLIVRRYLAALTGDPALFETHEEWVSRHDAVKSLNEDLRIRTHELFSQLATWKYAHADQGDEPSVVIDRSRQLIEAINREVAR